MELHISSPTHDLFVPFSVCHISTTTQFPLLCTKEGHRRYPKVDTKQQRICIVQTKSQAITPLDNGVRREGDVVWCGTTLLLNAKREIVAGKSRKNQVKITRKSLISSLIFAWFLPDFYVNHSFHPLHFLRVSHDDEILQCFGVYTMQTGLSIAI